MWDFQFCSKWRLLCLLKDLFWRDNNAAAAAAKLLHSCPTLCNLIDGSPSGFPIPGILQARTLECVAICFSNAWKWKVKVSRSVVSNPQRPHGLQPTRLLHPWDFPGKRTGVGCHIDHYNYDTLKVSFGWFTHWFSQPLTYKFILATKLFQILKAVGFVQWDM